MTGLWVQSTHYHAERKTKPSIPGSSMLSKTFVFGDSVLIPGATGARVAGSPSRRARPPFTSHVPAGGEDDAHAKPVMDLGFISQDVIISEPHYRRLDDAREML
jgi:hypothetical protein